MIRLDILFPRHRRRDIVSKCRVNIASTVIALSLDPTGRVV